MLSTAIALDVLEDRSDMVVGLAAETRTAFRGSPLRLYTLLRLRKLSHQIDAMFTLIHQAEVAKTIEQAEPARRAILANKLDNCCLRTTDLVSAIRSANFTFWARFYRTIADRLDSQRGTLHAHAAAFRLLPVFLGRPDEVAMIEALLNPPEPNDALRRAVAEQLNRELTTH